MSSDAPKHSKDSGSYCGAGLRLEDPQAKPPGPAIGREALQKTECTSDAQPSQSQHPLQLSSQPAKDPVAPVAPSKGKNASSEKPVSKRAQSAAQPSSHNEPKAVVADPATPPIVASALQLGKVRATTSKEQTPNVKTRPADSKGISKTKGLLGPPQTAQKQENQVLTVKATVSKAQPQSDVKPLATTQGLSSTPSNPTVGPQTGAVLQPQLVELSVGSAATSLNLHPNQPLTNTETNASIKSTSAPGDGQPTKVSNALATQTPATTAMTVNPKSIATTSHPAVTQVTRALAPRPTLIQPAMSGALKGLTHVYPTMMPGSETQVEAQKTQPVTQGPSITREIMKLIAAYLASTQQDESFGGNMSSLRDRLEADPSGFDSNRNLLSWHVRDTIRSEFYRVKYPVPPPPPLLLLVTQCEILLTNITSVQRPFYFPGTRVTVPTDTGARRMGSTLQLRTKMVAGRQVTEVMLHLDGPQGGEFPWVQSSSLMPASSVVATQAAQRAAVVSKYQNRDALGRSGTSARGGRRGRKATRVRGGAAQVDPKSATPGASSSLLTAAKASNVDQKGVKTQTGASTNRSGISASARGANALVRGGSTAGRSSSASGRGPSNGGKAGIGKNSQEATTVSVPVALVCATPPPRKHIIGDGRQLSYVSGSFRRALDSKGDNFPQDAVKIRALLGIERLVARRNVRGLGIQYFVKWSGRPFKDCSWEKRNSLLEDVPGLVREFDVRHPDECKLIDLVPEQKSLESTNTAKPAANINKAATHGGPDQSEGGFTERSDVLQNDSSTTKWGGNDGGRPRETSEFIDDVTGIPIPSWVDTPILELNISDMVLQVRRPNDYVLHNDTDAATRDMKKRQSEFKKKHVETAVQVYSLSRNEARLAIEHGLRVHRENSQRAIQFPRGLGRVSPHDHGVPFALGDVSNAPASWEGYLTHLGLRCTDFVRNLPPYMPSVDDNALSKIMRGCNDAAFATCLEHRERARNMVREAFRYDGSSLAPSTLFRDGVRVPPGSGITGKKRARSNAITAGCEDIGFTQEKLLRERDEKVRKVLDATVTRKPSRTDGMWYDSNWACWRQMPSGSD